MIINATLWCMNMEDEIKADADISFVGPYNPTTFRFKPSITDGSPGDIEGWDTAILKPKENWQRLTPIKKGGNSVIIVPPSASIQERYVKHASDQTIRYALKIENISALLRNA